jgi:hypothetical protein
VKIKVSAGFSGKISTGNFQNMSPSFFAEVEYETPHDGEELQKEIDLNQRLLHDIAYKNFKVVAEMAKVEKIKADLKGFRFYQTEKGQFPSVSTVNDPDYQPYVDDEALRIATAEGNICHARAAHYIKTGDWVDPKKLEGVAPDLIICRGRFLDYWDFPGMVKRFGITGLKNGGVLYNYDHKYAGTNDAECLYPLGGEKGAEIVPTIIDFKRTPDKDKNFTQMAAYAKCMPHIKQMMIIATNTDTQQGYSKPILSTAIDKYFEVFLDKRKQFAETYGL